MSTAKKPQPHVDPSLLELERQYRESLARKLQQPIVTDDDLHEAVRAIDTEALYVERDAARARALAPPGRKKGSKGKTRLAIEAMRTKHPNAKPRALWNDWKKAHGNKKPGEGRFLTIISEIDSKK